MEIAEAEVEADYVTKKLKSDKKKDENAERAVERARFTEKKNKCKTQIYAAKKEKERQMKAAKKKKAAKKEQAEVEAKSKAKEDKAAAKKKAKEEAEERAALGPKPTTMARQSSSRSASSSSQCSTSSFSDAESLLSLASEHMPPVGADNVASAIAKIQAKANGMSI